MIHQLQIEQFNHDERITRNKKELITLCLTQLTQSLPTYNYTQRLTLWVQEVITKTIIEHLNEMPIEDLYELERSSEL